MGNERLRRYRWRKTLHRRAVLRNRDAYHAFQTELTRDMDVHKPTRQPGLVIYGGNLSLAVADAVSRWFKQAGRR